MTINLLILSFNFHGNETRNAEQENSLISLQNASRFQISSVLNWHTECSLLNT